MAAAPPPQEQEFTVRVPARDEMKKYHVMKFNASLNIDFSKWTQARMVRENNEKILKSTRPEDDDPKFGAGSTFGKDEKEIARLKKLGITRKVYNPEAQPWLMRVGGKGGKKYKGIREGGVASNTTYYVFTHGKDGAFEAFPIKDWYNFTTIQRYKTLDAEEAEEKFANRGKVLNKWATMVHKKLKPEKDDEELDGEEGEGKKGKKGEKKSLMITDMDDWVGSDDGLDTDEEKKDDSDSDGGKKKKSKDTKKKGKKKKDVQEEAFDDSEDDDRQDREVDYMSDESSDSDDAEEDKNDAKGVEQDEGLSKMLDSDSSSDDENKDKDKEKEEEDDEDETGKKKKKIGSRGNSDDEEGGKGKKKGSSNNSRSGTPTQEDEKAGKAEKRKAMVAGLLDPNADGQGGAKKSRLEQFGGAKPETALAGNETISEEAVRRYLKRRPMTTTDLLKKFRSKKTGIQNAQLVQLLANILKKINPHKHKVKGVTYLSLKEEK